MRRIRVNERRARLAVRHHLAAAAQASTAVEAARGVVALHATDPATVFLSVQARTSSVTVEAIERVLYQERSLVRMLGMRRTMFVVPVDLVPAIQAACTETIAAKQWRVYAKLLADAGVGDEDWLKEVANSTERALVARGEATGAQLSTDEPRLRTQVLVSEGKPYEARPTITTWVLYLLAAEGRIVRGRPLGSWTSSQYRWAPADTWIPGGIQRLPAAEARVDLARRWLAAFGPATVADLRWWTGWTASQVKQALTVTDPVEVDLDGRPGIVLADDLEPAAKPDPWVALLPALDPTAMGWSERDWYLGPHTPALFDRSGNVGPTIWHDGRIVGGWAQRADGEIVYRLLDDIGRDAVAAVDQAADRLASWIGPIRVNPRFGTPLVRALVR